jgi:uncharacterized protein
MKKLIFLFICFISISASAQVEKYIPAAPNPPRLVNDFTKEKLLTGDELNLLERKLVAYDDSTSNQIAIVIVDDLHGYSAVDYAVALGRKWGVGGQKDFNNGVVILVSTGGEAGDRDAFIATGYGLEGAIPDVTANTILETELIPGLKSGNYYEGFNNTVDALIRAAAGEYTAPAGYRKNARDTGKGFSIIKIIIAIIILFIFIGMGGGNRGGGFMSRRGYRGFGPTIFGGLGGLGGGGFGGGGFGGGGGGGGFGGFGGGGFGGGGAGGKW